MHSMDVNADSFLKYETYIMLRTTESIVYYINM